MGVPDARVDLEPAADAAGRETPGPDRITAAACGWPGRSSTGLYNHEPMEGPPTDPRVRIELEPPVDIRQLRYFLAVAEELNFTRAAERLSVAQQSLSAAIREMEDALGTRLFERSTRHVALTDAGAVFVPAARRILSDLADALGEVRQVAAGRRGHLALGVQLAVHGLAVIRDAIRGFVDASPDVDVQVIGFDHADPSAGLAAETTDLAFVLGPMYLDGLASLTVLEEPRHVLLPVTHPLARRDEVRARDLTGLAWLRVPVAENDWTRFWFAHPLGEPATGPEVRSSVEWLPAVQSGRAVGYSLPSLAAGYLPADVTMVPVTDIEPGRVVLAWPADTADPLVHAFVRAVRTALDPGSGVAPIERAAGDRP